MSAGSFEQDGSRKRVAHKGATSNTELIKVLAAKKQNMGGLAGVGSSSATINRKPVHSPPKTKYFSMFVPAAPSPKRRKVVTDSEDEDDRVKKPHPSQTNGKSNIKTFTGTAFTTALGRTNVVKTERRKVVLSESDEDDDSPGWLSKANPSSIHGSKPISKKLVKFPPPVKTNFQVNRRAVLSSSSSASYSGGSSEEEEEEEEDFFKTDKGKSMLNGRKIESAQKKKPTDRIKASQISSDEDEDLSEETSSSSSDVDSIGANKKSLKELARQTKKISAREKRKCRQRDELPDVEEVPSDEQQNSDDNDGEMSFDSDDSGKKEQQSSKSIKKQHEMEEKCLDFVNSATAEELKSTDKFNPKGIKFIVEKRPFEDFDQLRSMMTQVPRGISQLETYLEYLENRGVLEQVLDDCKGYVKHIKEELSKMESTSLSSQPALLNPELSLHPYQQIGLQWLIMMNKLKLNAILGDEMGLGKTIQIIAFLAWSKEQPDIKGPHLIIVPSSTIENWMNEMGKWCPTLKVLTYYGSMDERCQLRQRASSRNVDVILTTYNMVISKVEDRSFFKRFALNYVIYDEGHMLRSCNTLRYKNLMRIQGQRKILLTGTPLQNNLVELISLLFFTMTKMFTKYCTNMAVLLQMFARKGKMLDNKKAGKYGRRSKSKKEEIDDDNDVILVEEADQANGAEEDGPLYERHKIAQAKNILKPFILRRLKTEVLVALPKKHEKITMCPITEVQEELYNCVMDDLREQKEAGGGVNFVSLLMQMRQTANHPLLYRRNFDNYKLMEMAKVLCVKERQYREKNPEHVAEDLSYQTDIVIHSMCKKFRCMRPFELDRELSLDSGKCKLLDQMLPGIIAKGEKVLIFSQFTMLLDILELYMECRDYKFCRLDGSTPVMERQELINMFNHDKSIPVFLLSTKAGGLGINLTAANNIIIHDIDLNPYNDKQAEDRCHRMGQTREVYVTRLVSKNTIEESILALAQKKLELEKDVTEMNSSHLANPDEEQRLDSNIVEKMLTQALAKSKAKAKK